jgi:hypothetical protein
MKLLRRQFLDLALGTAALATISRFVWAQSYPERPVRIVSGFPPGGVNDTYARLIGHWLSERLGVFATPRRPPRGRLTGAILQASGAALTAHPASPESVAAYLAHQARAGAVASTLTRRWAGTNSLRNGSEGRQGDRKMATSRNQICQWRKQLVRPFCSLYVPHSAASNRTRHGRSDRHHRKNQPS